jgi:hypothetical protein
MDQDVLVEPIFEDGAKVIRRLRGDQFGVAVAFWTKTSDDGLWQFWIASSAVNPARMGDAIKVVFQVLDKLPDITVTPSDIRLTVPTDPVARDAIALRDRYPSRMRTRFHGMRLGKMATVDLCIYPRRLPLEMRDLPDGRWEVLVSETNDQWLTCDSEEDARAIASTPVLEDEALDRLKSGPQFRSELEKTADVLEKYRLGPKSRFLRRLVQKVRDWEIQNQGAA